MKVLEELELGHHKWVCLTQCPHKLGPDICQRIRREPLVRILVIGNGGRAEVQTEIANGRGEEIALGVTEGKSFKEASKKKKGVSFNDRIYYNDGTSITIDTQI